jgi:SAM-dependent methyltransferase
MTSDIKEQGTEFWNHNPCGGSWKNYQEFTDYIQRTEPYIFRILDRYDWQGKQVLEVGCGQGATLNYLPKRGAFMYGIDMSADSLAQARVGASELGHLDHIKLSIGDAENLFFSDASFDVVICGGVLHHTEDTLSGVKEIYRVLKPGGVAIVMLYRSGNPKWWATKLLRRGSSMIDWVSGKNFFIAESLRRRKEEGSLQGTALLELFGVPILKAFSNEESRKMFEDYSRVHITNYQPGFERNCDIIRALKPFRNFFHRIDVAMQDRWGFYQVIEACK